MTPLAEEFQSTHPGWGGTKLDTSLKQKVQISIHPPRVGWDVFWDTIDALGKIISIHPPRVGWDVGKYFRISAIDISIHPPRVGWDNTQADGLPDADISIHPPRVGWDVSDVFGTMRDDYFNPPTPGGVGRQGK